MEDCGLALMCALFRDGWVYIYFIFLQPLLNTTPPAPSAQGRRAKDFFGPFVFSVAHRICPLPIYGPLKGFGGPHVGPYKGG